MSKTIPPIPIDQQSLKQHINRGQLDRSWFDKNRFDWLGARWVDGCTKCITSCPHRGHGYDRDGVG